jgi:hypothetical protein
MLEITITNEEKVLISVNPVTLAGRAAAIDGPVTVSVVGGDSTFDAIGGSTFYLISADSPGDTTFMVSADADLGDGVVTIQDLITLHVAGALALNLGITASAPELK